MSNCVFKQTKKEPKFISVVSFSAVYNSEGGRRSSHLLNLVNFAAQFSHIVIIVGDNDVNSVPVETILSNYNDFTNAVWPSKVKIVGHMRRKDLDAELVSSNNMFLSEALGICFKSAKMIKLNDFHDEHPFHFHPLGEGYRHLAALILSLFIEFDEFW